MVDKIVYDVDLAIDVKLLVSTNRDVTFDDPILKDRLKNADDDAFIRVGKRLGSLHIFSLDIVDMNFLSKIFGGDDDQDTTS